MKARTSGRGGPCEAVQYSDQMKCARCGLAYDVNDPDPPDCKPQTFAEFEEKVVDSMVKAYGLPREVITTPQPEQNGPSKAREILDRLGL